MPDERCCHVAAAGCRGTGCSSPPPCRSRRWNRGRRWNLTGVCGWIHDGGLEGPGVGRGLRGSRMGAWWLRPPDSPTISCHAGCIPPPAAARPIHGYCVHPLAGSVGGFALYPLPRWTRSLRVYLPKT